MCMGLPSILTADNGSEFRNNAMMKQLGIRHCLISPYTSYHESTNYTPFEVMFGRKARLPIDADLESICELLSFFLPKLDLFIFLIYIALNTFLVQQRTKHSQPHGTGVQTKTKDFEECEVQYPCCTGIKYTYYTLASCTLLFVG